MTGGGVERRLADAANDFQRRAVLGECFPVTVQDVIDGTRRDVEVVAFEILQLRTATAPATGGAAMEANGAAQSVVVIGPSQDAAEFAGRGSGTVAAQFKDLAGG